MNILIVYPHGNALQAVSGASSRVYTLIKFLVNSDFKITILHSINAKGLEDIYLKKKCKIYYYNQIKYREIPDWYLSDLNPFFILKLIRILRKHSFDMIQVEFLWGFIITKIITTLFKRGKKILIYDSQGVEGEFIKVSQKNPKFPKYFKPFATIYTKNYERLSCKLATFNIVVSDIDKKYYINNYAINKNKVLTIQIPSVLEVRDLENIDQLKNKYRKCLSLPANKTLILFHGSLPHPANQEAFNLIKNYIARNFNDSETFFVLAGKNVKKFKKDNIISLGFVDKLEYLLLSADFAIVPVISGCGMRVKCIDYIIAGLPFITTEKGLEGINFLEDKIDCLIYKNVDTNFLEGIRNLNKDKKYREFLKQNLLKKSKIINQNNIRNRYIKLYNFLKKHYTS